METAHANAPERRRRSIFSRLGLLALLCASGIDAQEIQVNSYTTSFQNRPRVAALANGQMMVVWVSGSSPGDDQPTASIQGQLLDDAGQPIGDQFQINESTTGTQTNPAVAASPNGEFVVSWQSVSSAGGDESAYSVQTRVYEADGTARSGEIQANTYVTAEQFQADVDVDADGDFVVVFTANGTQTTTAKTVLGQRFDGNGTFVGSEFEVPSLTTNDQLQPSVSVDPSDGEFVVVWGSGSSNGTDVDGYSIQAQRFASDGAALGPQFQVNQDTFGDQRYAAIDHDGLGGFIVVWHSNSLERGSSTIERDVRGRRFDDLGTAIGDEFAVNSVLTGHQEFPEVAVDADGSFAVVWQSDLSAGNDLSALSVQSRRFNAAGEPIGDDFQVNTLITGDQARPHIALDPEGRPIVVWESDVSAGDDTSSNSIQLALSPLLFTDGFESGDLTAWSSSTQ